MSTALITGAAKNIGREIALSLAAENINIALHCNKSIEQAKKTQAEILKKGVKCKIFNYDLCKTEKIKTLIENVKKEFKDFDILINNASVFIRASIKDTSEKIFNEAFQLNFAAPFFLSKAFVMQCKKGNIINLLDTKVAENDYIYSAYNLSKKTLAEFTKMGALEFAPKIKVNAIALGIILIKDSDKPLKSLAKKAPLGNSGRLEDVKKTISFLLKSTSITGEIIYLDGGKHLVKI
ncbi:MAG: SDR family oxidoreductase [Verrucomicrobiota bacterium]|nr:SDR family oxidoreductase [Verrucomicrobiota bacterium]